MAVRTITPTPFIGHFVTQPQSVRRIFCLSKNRSKIVGLLIAFLGLMIGASRFAVFYSYCCDSRLTCCPSPKPLISLWARIELLDRCSFMSWAGRCLKRMAGTTNSELAPCRDTGSVVSFYNNLTDPRGLPKYAEVRQTSGDVVAWICGLDTSPGLSVASTSHSWKVVSNP